jgi:hypothetical protein
MVIVIIIAEDVEVLVVPVVLPVLLFIHLVAATVLAITQEVVAVHAEKIVEVLTQIQDVDAEMIALVLVREVVLALVVRLALENALDYVIMVVQVMQMQPH